MKIYYPVLVALVAITLAGYVRNRSATKIEVVEIKDFHCQSVSGFSFQYPIFKNWIVSEFKYDEQRGFCLAGMNNPSSNIDYEQARQIAVFIVPNNQGDNQTPSGTKKNKNSVKYKLVEHDGDFGPVYEFYGTELNVQIGIIAEEEKQGFSEKLFWQAVIKSFIFSK